MNIQVNDRVIAYQPGKGIVKGVVQHIHEVPNPVAILKLKDGSLIKEDIVNLALDTSNEIKITYEEFKAISATYISENYDKEQGLIFAEFIGGLCTRLFEEVDNE